MLSKKGLTCIPREHKSFWQLHRLDDFAINANAHLFVYERLKIPEPYTEPIRTSKMELLADKLMAESHELAEKAPS